MLSMSSFSKWWFLSSVRFSCYSFHCFSYSSILPAIYCAGTGSCRSTRRREPGTGSGRRKGGGGAEAGSGGGRTPSPALILALLLVHYHNVIMASKSISVKKYECHTIVYKQMAVLCWSILLIKYNLIDSNISWLRSALLMLYSD